LSARPAEGLLQCLQHIPDPRGRKGRRHDFVAMLATVVSAMLCGRQSFDAIAEWIHTFEAPFWHRLGYLRRPPTANSFRNLLDAIDPEALEAALWQWAEGLGLCLGGHDVEAVSIDGKTLRGAIAAHGRAWNVLSVMDQATGCVLRETPVHADTNEAKAALSLLENLVLEGRVVVGDAMFCQRDVCEKILEQGGDYLVIVKGNQPALQRQMQNAFALPRSFSPLPQTAGA
jgi:DDE_Tnp_1-associated/Transposase DDE domain